MYFYHELKKGKHIGTIKGFPQTTNGWCHQLKYGSYIRKSVLQEGSWEDLRLPDATRELVYRVKDGSVKGFYERRVGVIQYLGIAVDEPVRIERHTKPNVRLPLVEIGWSEAYCRKWCEEHDLLSPLYATADRGGCWFCHNQGVSQLRQLRKNYPELWALLLKWDNDSPVTFKADGHTVHDFDKRFEMEDNGIVYEDERWRWSYLKEAPARQLEMFGRGEIWKE